MGLCFVGCPQSDFVGKKFFMTNMTYHRKKQSYRITYDACDRIMSADILTHPSLYFEKLCFSV